jgi:pimeloyl-ACP methyl ester carboxylesterase
VLQKTRRIVGAALIAVMAGGLIQLTGSSALADDQAPVECPAGAPLSASCGELAVSENRANPAARTITVPYLVVPAAEQPATGEPIVAMAGGPGHSGVSLATALTGNLGLGTNHDVVVIDQRGFGTGAAALACDDVSTALVDITTSTDRLKDEAAVVGLAMKACLKEFTAAGGDPSGYSIAQSAADVIELRAKLGYENWTLFGTDWSSRVMAAVASLDPAGATKLIFSGFAAADRDVKGDAYGAVTEAITALAERQGVAPETLIGQVADAAELLDESPVKGPIIDPYSGQQRYAKIGGDDFYTVLQFILADPDLIPTVPALLDRVTDGKTDALRPFISEALRQMGQTDWALFFVQSCLDSQPYWSADPAAPDAETPAEGEAAAPTPVTPPRLTALGVTDTVCQQLALPVPAPDFRVAPAFTQPTLLIGSASDPVSRFSVAQYYADNLPNVQLVSVPNTGHAVAPPLPCLVTAVATWLADPASTVAGACDEYTDSLAVISADAIHPTSRYDSVDRAVGNLDWFELLIPLIFAVFCVFWLLGWAITVIVRAVQRERIRLLLFSGIAPVTGVIGLLIAWIALSAASAAQPAQALLGVPSIIPILGVLLGIGLLSLIVVWKLGSRGAALLATSACLVWLATIGWFVWIFVLPS